MALIFGSESVREFDVCLRKLSGHHITSDGFRFIKLTRQNKKVFKYLEQFHNLKFIFTLFPDLGLLTTSCTVNKAVYFPRYSSSYIKPL